MTYLIYARKYRPKLFEDMIGQKAVVQTLQNAIKNNRVAQAYLFSGMRGVGKTTAARILAKALNCVHGPTPTPCNVCEMCVEIDEDRSLDVLEIDGASNGGIEQIRSLRDSVKYKPIRARTKIIYIDEVHQVSGPAFNALLKTLEEPPQGTVFIFATTEFHKVPATIVSRCQHFEFKKVSHREIVNHLNGIAGKEHLTITEYGLGLIAEASEGSIRDAQSLLDQAVSFCGESIGDADLGEILGAINRSFLFEFSTAVVEGKSDQIFALTGKVMDAGYDLRHFYKALVLHFRDLLLMRTVEKPEELLVFTPEDMARLKDEAGRASGEEWLRWLQAMQSAEGGLKFASHPQIYFETLLVRLCHFKEIVPIRDLLKEIEELKSSGGGTGEVRRVPVLPGSSPRPAESKPKPPAPPAQVAPRAAAAPAEPPPAERAEEAPADSGRAAEGDPPPNGLPGRRLSDREMALKDPSVSLFMKKFKAQILAVQPPSGGKDEEE